MKGKKRKKKKRRGRRLSERYSTFSTGCCLCQQRKRAHKHSSGGECSEEKREKVMRKKIKWLLIVSVLCVCTVGSSVLQSGLGKNNNNKGLLGGFRYTKEQDMGKKRSGPEVSVGFVVMLRLQWVHTQHFLIVFAH